MLDRVSGTLSRYNMCAPGQHVAVAVSGGADSVCLLYLLHELAASLGITLSVAHLNHKLRGAESDGDAEFAKQLAENLRLPFHYKEVEVSSIEGNLEQASRDARHRFFDALQADRIATGHTQTDQAETVLYRLLRGSGTAGLAGVLPVAGRRIRPLIDCTRDEVREYLASFRIRVAGGFDEFRYLVCPELHTSSDPAGPAGRYERGARPDSRYCAGGRRLLGLGDRPSGCSILEASS